jgi:8-amino-7-oxononanoate synthase
MLAGIEAELEELKHRDLYRCPTRACGIDFTSNDYLALSCHPALRAAGRSALDHGPTGAGASRLLRGTMAAHVALEEFAAGFFGCERALFFGSGYVASLALFSALLDRQDAVIFDASIHASMKEGIHVSNAKRFRARHNDPESFRDAMRSARERGARRLLIAVESVYSMDGDVAPLRELSRLAVAHEAMLVVDEAHATGIFGARGRGCSEELPQENLISVHTCGKALGVAGALICASASIVDYLVNKARPFIYSTAPPPVIAAMVARALQLIDEEPWRRARLLQLARSAHDALCPNTQFRGTQIIPVILGDAGRALAVANALQASGFDVRAVRPPTVPEDTSRLRISIHADHQDSDIARLAHGLRSALAQ